MGFIFDLARDIFNFIPKSAVHVLFWILKYFNLLPGFINFDPVLFFETDVPGYAVEPCHPNKHIKLDLSVVVSDFAQRRVKVPFWTLHTLPLIRDLPVEDTDVFVCTFMKAGTTWMQHISYLVMTLDFDNKTGQEERFPQLDFSSGVLGNPLDHIEYCRDQPAPRFFKCHLPLPYLPRDVLQGKVIYVARNPKDNIVSWYHFSQRLQHIQYGGSLSDMVTEVIADKVHMGPMADHVKEYWAIKDHPNVLFLFYEDLIADHRGGVVKVADFLGKKLTDSQIDHIVAETTFSSMRSNPATDWRWSEALGCFPAGSTGTSKGLYRKGQVGSWRDDLSQEDSDRIDRWATARYADIKFKGM